MKCLVVLTHPLKDSLCHHFCDETVKHLTAKGYEITLLNLYESDFEPALKEDERRSYYADQFDDSRLKTDIQQLQEAESLVLIFPTWWFGFPAMLKGWFDRVWAPGFAYDHAKDLGAIQPRLDNLKEVKVVTTLGSPWWVDLLILRQPVKKVLKIALLGACTKGCKFQMLSFYKSEDASKDRVEAFVNKLKAKF
ncbi:NAD(P)H-dependent oxidoreductase [Neptuniibacter sp. QD72_48]|uniref:NAD(P)H-dependent oxidoreductase n=1 Tax=Neptuniibacter sp. QD72_48 TaxID=3398214 RepID=UPI0039F5C01F